MRWLENRRTMTKLILGFVAVALVTAGVGSVGLSRLGRVNALVDEVNVASRAGEVENGILALMYQIRLTRARGIILAGLGAAADKELAKSDSLRQVLIHRVASLDSVIDSEGRAGMDRLKASMGPFQKLDAESWALIRDRRPREAFTLTEEEASVNVEPQTATLALLQTSSIVAQRVERESETIYARARTVLTGLIVGGVVLSLLMGWLIARIISVPLAQGVEVLEAVAGGDYTRRVKLARTDEVGRLAAAVDRTVESVGRVLLEVRSTAEEVASASGQLAAASEAISSGAQESASSLEETAANLEEITSTVKQNADNAQQASQLAAGARDVAEKGGRVVGDAVGAMNEINRSSQQIADIITTIDEIAFQTNLLALNAAVEAARAGEQGRGFAVVAAEVRNLAQRSAEAAKEIKALIQDSVRKVETGAGLVNESGRTLAEIVTAVKRVTDVVQEIAAASREQSAGIDQVNTAVAQMDQVTQANASQTEELSATAESLHQQARQLRAVVERFKLAGSEPGLGAERSRGAVLTPVTVA